MYTCHCASPVKVLIIPTVKNTQNGRTHNCERLSNVFRGVPLTAFLEPEVVLKYVFLTTIISGIKFHLQPNASFCGNTCIYTAKRTYQKKHYNLEAPMALHTPKTFVLRWPNWTYHWRLSLNFFAVFFSAAIHVRKNFIIETVYAETQKLVRRYK